MDSKYKWNESKWNRRNRLLEIQQKEITPETGKYLLFGVKSKNKNKNGIELEYFFASFLCEI